jgi:hypothetical protein
VLTAKKSLFWGVLAGKRGSGAVKKTSFFALFHVFVVFLLYKPLSCKLFRPIRPAEKNRAKKPTVGF